MDSVFLSGLSNERLEQEIASCYWEAFLGSERGGVPVGLSESGLLGLLWGEFDRRFVLGLIDPDPFSGCEPVEVF